MLGVTLSRWWQLTYFFFVFTPIFLGEDEANLTFAHIFQMGGTKTTKQLSECEEIAAFFVLPIHDTTIGTFARHQRFERCQRDEKV